MLQIIFSDPCCFDLNHLDADEVVAQIICINADLYKQLQITEFLDLRYQKDKKFSVSLNKVHEFSNKVSYFMNEHQNFLVTKKYLKFVKKIYLLVPTSILESDDIEVQKTTLKKWIVIAEKLFQLRDYNSTIQIINGIAEVSIMRLEHLKGVRFSISFLDL